MDAYPLAMRERILAVWDEGGLTQDEVADQFAVPSRWLCKLLALRRAGTSIAAKPHAGGRRAAVDGPAEQKIRNKLALPPDALLEELRAHLAVRASLPCLSRTLARLGITR